VDPVFRAERCASQEEKHRTQKCKSTFGSDAVATIAGLLSTSSFVPQVVKAWRERDTKAISKHMYLVTVTAFVLWSTYGVLIGSWPMVVFNVLSLILSATILACKIRNDRRRSPVARSRREPGLARSG